MASVTVTEAPVAARRHLSGALVLTATMLAVSGSNYLLNLVLARFLSPAEFGDANLAINLVLIAAAAAATLQLLSARSGAIDDPAAVATRRRLTRGAWIIGGIAGAGMTFGSFYLADTFSTSTPLVFVLIGIGLPIYLTQAVFRGALQGDLRLGRLAVSYAVEAAVRVAISLGALALGYGVTGAAAAISVSFVASALIARHRVAVPVDDRHAVAAPSGLAALSLSATALLVGQVVIANGDVVLAKAVMAPETAGTYAAAAVIGRGLFFLSWAVVHSTFPVVARAENAADRRPAAVRALAMVMTMCAAAVIGLAVLGDRIAPLLLGDAFADAADILVPYAVATTLFAVANLVASLDLAAGRWRAPGALLIGAGLQTLLLISFGSTPMSMTLAQVVAMALTALLVGAAHLCDNRMDRQGSQSTKTPYEHGDR